jgi:hypothetical protein
MGMNSACRPAIGNGMAFVSTARQHGCNSSPLQLGGDGDVTSSNVVWKQPKRSPRYSSPLFVDGLIYTANEKGIVYCLDAETASSSGTKKLGGLFMPSPIADGKHISSPKSTYISPPGHSIQAPRHQHPPRRRNHGQPRRGREELDCESEGGGFIG